MSIRYFAIFAWLLSSVTATSPASAMTPSALVLPSYFAAGPLILDDRPEPLSPIKPKTEADRDRVEAKALFSAGRMHEQRNENTEALRCYERALRYDPKSSTTANAIIRVALGLQHYSEAARYAMKAVEFEDADPVLLRRVGSILMLEGDSRSATVLCEKALAVRANAKETVSDILLRLEMGRLYCLTEKYPKAAECFAHVLDALNHPAEFPLDDQMKKELFCDPEEMYQLMGESFLAADRPKDAVSAFEKADELAPDKAMRQFNLARVLAKTGKPAEALAALEASFAEQLDIESSLPFQTLAEVLGALGKKDELQGRLEKLQLSMPTNRYLRYYLAKHYWETKQLAKAESLYRELLKTSLGELAYNDLLNLFWQNKRFDALLALKGDVIEDFGPFETFSAESLTASQIEERAKEILTAAKIKLKEDPDKFTYGMRLAAALCALEAKQFDTADEFFHLALAAKPKEPFDVFLFWGMGLLTDNRPAEAAKVFQRAIDEKAGPADKVGYFHFYLAGALVLIGRTDEALAAARIAAEKNPTSAAFQGRSAWVLYYAKRHDEAAKAYRELIEKFDATVASADTPQTLLEARRALSNLCALKGDNAQAEEWLEQVLDEFPDDAGALNDLGFLWVDQGKHLERAQRMIQQAVEAEPNNMAFRDSLGWALFRQGKYPEAVAELEKAAADKKSGGLVLDHLGDAYHHANQLDKAVEAWGRAVQAFQTEKEVDKAKAVEIKIRAN
jgi:tetratricopeptide (TPR) repeat protein